MARRQGIASSPTSTRRRSTTRQKRCAA
jgi:hypothetical protein